MGRARYNTGLFPLPDNVLPVQLFGGTSLIENEYFMVYWYSPLERGVLRYCLLLQYDISRILCIFE